MGSPTSYVPHPRDYRTIREDVALHSNIYVVPAGKVFVLTGLGTTCVEFDEPDLSQEQPLFPALLTAIFFPGMPDHAIFGDNGDDVRAGVIGPSVNACLTGPTLRRNFCSVAAVPPGCVYHEGTQIEVFGGHSPSPFTDVDARAYGYEAPAS